MGYKTVKYGKKAERRNYSRMLYDVELPNLIEVQTNSFDNFVKKGINELLHDISPIEGYSGDLKLHFEKCFFSEPKHSIEEAKLRDVDYSRQLSADVKLENVITGEVRQTKVLMTDLPMMTPSGTFIINGSERVVVSQIVRSSGVYFTSEYDEKINKIKYAGQMMPTRGAWIELEQGAKEILYVKIDRSKKIPLTTLIRALGFQTKKEIEETFGKNVLLNNTYNRDETKNPETAVVELYSKLRQGEIVPPEAAREHIRSRFFDRRRYDLASVGRFKYNKKLDVLSRALNTYLAEPIFDENGEVLFGKDTFLNRRVLNEIKKVRHLLLKEVISKENNIENEMGYEILSTSLPEGGDALYAKEPIADLKTGEILIRKNEEITPEKLILLRKHRSSLDDRVVKYFLSEDFYQKESTRKGVYVETLNVYRLDDNNEQLPSVKLVGSNQDEDRKHVVVSDIIASISYYLNLYEGIGLTDDIDHLGNRRVRLIGELLKNQFRIGLAKAEKSIKDKMSVTSFVDATPANIMNMMPLSSTIRNFFGSSQLSQFMDQINPLAELTQKRRISALGPGGIKRDRAGVEVRDVHTSHFGRLCPIETPEGPSIGLISSLTTYAKVDQYGFIKTPFLKVVQKDDDVTQVTNEFIYLTADDEREEYIASAATLVDTNGNFTEKRIIARSNGETAIYDRNIITYMDVSPNQLVSVATASIPFLEHDDASRALMGANMQRQAVPLLQPESPIVGTGIEHRAAKDSGVTTVSRDEGFVTYVDASKIVITKKPSEDVKKGNSFVYKTSEEFNFETAIKLRDKRVDESVTYNLTNYKRSNQDTLILQKPLVEYGEYINVGDVISDGPATNKGELALGRNVTVAFMTWEGYNYEDAIVMNEELVEQDVFTSIHIDEYEVETRELKLPGNKEIITREIPYVSQDALRYLDERGIIVPGTEVKEGDILVGKITPKGALEPTPEDRLIFAVLGDKSKDYRDSSLKVPHGGGGIVQEVQYFSKANGDKLPPSVIEQIKVYVAQKRKINEGDKMAGRHGNKGVISKILPKEDMPYLEDGTPVDILLNPLGVPSRMNIGQILEIHLGLAAKNLNIKVATPVFDGVSIDELKDIMNEAGVPEDGKTYLYDGRTGEKYESRISYGVMYMLKLAHMVDDKLHARSVGPYTIVTQQPMGGKAQNGGQRFGEMEVWALYAYGAAHTLQELLTIKSDDMVGRNNVYSAISQGRPIPKPSIPESFRVLTKELQALGLYTELVNIKTGENIANKSLVLPSKPKGGLR